MIQDKCGNQITEGCYIVYGTERAELKFGKVISVAIVPDEYYDRNLYEISVFGINEWWKDKVVGKKGIVRDPDKIIVLPFAMLPDYAQKLLNNI